MKYLSILLGGNPKVGFFFFWILWWWLVGRSHTYLWGRRENYFD